MSIFYDNVRVNTATVGTGTLDLGDPVIGCNDFVDAGVVDGAEVSYGIIDVVDPDVGPIYVEVGWGIYNLGAQTLTRATVLSSNNGGAKISLTGYAQVYLTVSAQDLMNITAGGHVIQSEGTPFTARGNLNLIGFTVEDDAGNNATKVSISGVPPAVKVYMAANFV